MFNRFERKGKTIMEHFNHTNVKELVNDKPIAAYIISSSSYFRVLFESKKVYGYFTSDFCFDIENETFDKSLVYEIVECVPELEDLIGYKPNNKPKREKLDMKYLYMGHGSRCIIRKDLLHMADEYDGSDTFFIRPFYNFLDKMEKTDLSNIIKKQLN